MEGGAEGLSVAQLRQVTRTARELIELIAGDSSAVVRVGTTAATEHDGVVVVLVVRAHLVRYLVGTDGKTARAASYLLRVYSKRLGMPRCDIRILGALTEAPRSVAWLL